MQADAEYLRPYYSSLSDEALLSIKRSDLTEVAQPYYDAEIKQRGLDADEPEAEPSETAPPRPVIQRSDDGEEPPWLNEAAEVYSAVVVPGSQPADDCAAARDVLEAAEIPCFLELREIPEDAQSTAPPPTHQWRLLVPGNLNLQAASILDRDLFNQDFENEWKAHLEELSDDEVLEMDPQVVFCGLFDRVERVKRAYKQEIKRRGL